MISDFIKHYQPIINILFSQSLLLSCSPEALGQTTTFIDIESHWAQPCIENLAKQGIVGGDAEQQQFRPNATMKRVEFAMILTQAFPDVKPVQEPTDFVDIPSDYWAYSAIQEANRRGFLSSYIAGVFNPTIEVTRLQALEALTQGLKYQRQLFSTEELSVLFEDADEIPEQAKTAVAAATENWLVVNYPNVKKLNPNQSVTRAEVAAFICQALAKPQEQALIPSQYIARVSIRESPIPSVEAISRTLETSGLEKEEVEPSLTEPNNRTVTASNRNQNPADVLQNSSEQQIEIGNSGTVKVELFHPSDQSLQLKIIRQEEQKMSELIHSNAQVIDVKILNLDQNQEPEVMIDFVSRDASNRPLYYSLIYRYSSFTQTYKSLQHAWGIKPYEQQNSAINNLPIFISYDHRFSENYQSQIAEHLPLKIWQYQPDKMEDKTSDYPELIQKQAALLWLQLNHQGSQSQQSLQGMIAAYLANKSILGEIEEGWQRVQPLYQGRDATTFFSQLRQFLQQTGYLE